MRKTNCKEVKAAVRSYIMECIPEGMTIQEVHQNFIKTYYNTDDEKRYFRYVEQNAFKDWLSTIPGAFNVDFVTYDICHIVGSWLDETEDEINNYLENDSDKAESLFKMLVTKHFYEMLAETK